MIVDLIDRLIDWLIPFDCLNDSLHWIDWLICFWLFGWLIDSPHWIGWLNDSLHWFDRLIDLLLIVRLIDWFSALDRLIDWLIQLKRSVVNFESLGLFLFGCHIFVLCFCVSLPKIYMKSFGSFFPIQRQKSGKCTGGNQSDPRAPAVVRFYRGTRSDHGRYRGAIPSPRQNGRTVSGRTIIRPSLRAARRRLWRGLQQGPPSSTHHLRRCQRVPSGPSRSKSKLEIFP